MLHYGDLGIIWAEVKGEGTGMRKKEKAHTQPEYPLSPLPESH